jgi:hypothetical protein
MEQRPFHQGYKTTDLEKVCHGKPPEWRLKVGRKNILAIQWEKPF